MMNEQNVGPETTQSPNPQRRHRRYTSIERWQNARTSVYTAARSSIFSAANAGLQIIAGSPEFDLDRYYDHVRNETRQSKSSSNTRFRETVGSRDGQFHQLSNVGQSRAQNPFDDRHSVGARDEENPFDDPQVGNADIVQEQYHVATKRQKWFIVATIGAAGLFSGLSSNIYLPSLDAVARDLKVSLGAVSLTITSYLIVQGISPVFWGAFSDTVGRRPIYIASFTVYIIANIVLSFSPNFVVLLLFRGLQAAGSTSTVSIGNGVIQDISPPAERGAFISFYQAIRNVSIAIGPVLGGALSQAFGFRSVFIFLLASSSVVIAIIIIFLPETMRSIAGNGSLQLSGIYQPLIYRFNKESRVMQEPEDTVPRKKVTIATFVEPLKLLLEKDILLNLVLGGYVYAVWSMVTASTTSLFKQPFKLNEVLLGLIFLPNGFGTIVGSAIIGKLLTKDYLTTTQTYLSTHPNLKTTTTQKLNGANIPPDFPLERARLRHLPWLTSLFALSTASYGFTLSFPALLTRPGWLAVPLVFQFLIAATSNAIFALNQTLISDLCPGRGASASAVNNLVRCSFGAVGVALVDALIGSVGPGVAFLGLALFTVVLAPLILVVWVRGPEWRARRMGRKEGES